MTIVKKIKDKFIAVLNQNENDLLLNFGYPTSWNKFSLYEQILTDIRYNIPLANIEHLMIIYCNSKYMYVCMLLMVNFKLLYCIINHNIFVGENGWIGLT